MFRTIAWRGDQEIGRTSLSTATGDVMLAASVDRSEIRNDGTDLAFVELALVDATGTLYADRDREITIERDGPAVLQAFGSANRSAEERFTVATRTTFEGRALAVVRPNGTGGITLRAIGAGCRSVTVAITAG